MPAPPRDLCKGCRECYNTVMGAIVQSPAIAGILMGLPVYFMLLCIAAYNSNLYIYVNYRPSTAPFYTLFAFTVAGWLIELIGIRWTLPNLLHICAFAHAAIGSWWLVNFVILFFAGWSYLPANLMTIVLVGFLAPSAIWHFTGDIIRAYKKKLIAQIENHHRALAQQAEAFTAADVIGEQKV
jgi:hypothetical protein